MGFDRLFVELGVVVEVDDRGYGLAPFIIRHAYDQRVPDGGMGLEHFLDLLGINFLSRRVDADASAAEQGQAAIGFYPTPVARNGIAHPIDRAKRLRGFLGVLVIAYGARTLPGDKSRPAAPRFDFLVGYVENERQRRVSGKSWHVRGD